MKAAIYCRVVQMCKAEGKQGCEHLETLRGRPEECTHAQVKECHGKVIRHLCLEEKTHQRVLNIAIL